MQKINRGDGFTLLELMVVLVVIGVMLGLATVAIGPRHSSDLQREARRLHAVLQMAVDEAQMQGVEMALSLSSGSSSSSSLSQLNGYQFLMLDNEDLTWSPVNLPQFDLYHLGNDISITIEIDGKRLDKEMIQQLNRIQALQSQSQLQPVLLLLSSGEISPFIITLRHPLVEQAVKIGSDGVAEITIR